MLRFFTKLFIYICNETESLLGDRITSRIATQNFPSQYVLHKLRTLLLGVDFLSLHVLLWAYSSTFPYFMTQAQRPYSFSFSPHEMDPHNYSPYLHKVDFWEMFKSNLFSKYHELLGNESEKTVIFFFLVGFNLLLFFKILRFNFLF